MFGKSIFFFIKAVLFGLATVIAIPREQYKKFLLYGFIFGGVGDAIVASVCTYLHLIKYLNMGVFNILGLFSCWTPIAWMFAFMLFFYFLPVRKVFLIPYVIGFGFLAYMVGTVLQNMGLFQYLGINRYISPIIFIGWFATSAWVYLRSERIELK